MPVDPVADPSSDPAPEASPKKENNPTSGSQPSSGPIISTPTEPAGSDEPVEEMTPPRQEGTQLSSEQLAYFGDLFGAQGNKTLDRLYHTHYNLVLIQCFASPQEISMHTFFSLGFSNEWQKPITDAERAYYVDAIDYEDGEFTLDMVRLPKALVDYTLEYYFCEEIDLSSLVFNPDTQCYYLAVSDASMYPNPKFQDGYFDEETGLVSLYYTNVFTGEEFIITLQSKASLGETGYYIISNLPIA